MKKVSGAKKKPSEISKLILKIAIVASAMAILLGFAFFYKNEPAKKPRIVASNFAGYDLARAVLGDSSEIEMLVAPGSDLHHYEPSQQDVIDIKSAELFIYAGGESEEWVEKIVDDNLTAKTLNMIEIEGLNLLNEDDNNEIDEHYWTSIGNYLLMLEAVKNQIIEIDPENAELYRENAQEYREKLQELDEDLRMIINSSNKKTIVFADRFPAKYFFSEYGLEYIAAFPGCAEDTEADAATVSKIINLIKLKNISSIFTIELSDGKLAKTISGSTHTKILKFQSLQNVSKQDFAAGKTYVDLMSENIEPLTEALN